MRFAIFIFVLVLLSISFFLRWLIAPQSATHREVDMMSRSNTRWIVLLYGTYIVLQKWSLLLCLPKDHPCLGNYILSQTYVQGLIWLGELFIISNSLRDSSWFHTWLWSSIRFQLVSFECITKEFIPAIILNDCRPWVST